MDGSAGAQPIACRLPAALQTGTVITFPLIHWPYSMKSMWMQVTDQGRCKLVDGYLSYSPESVWRDYWRNPVLRSLLSIQGEFSSPVELERDRGIAAASLQELHASAIVIFDSHLNKTQPCDMLAACWEKKASTRAVAPFFAARSGR